MSGLENDTMIPARASLHHHTLRSESLQKLHECPRPANEIGKVNPSGTGLRNIMRKLAKPIGSGLGGGGNYGKWTMVYYLYGDERRAIRVAIEENEEYIKKALSGDAAQNAFAQAWSDGLYLILCEEWQMYNFEK